MSELFTTFLYQPLLNALIALYQFIPGQDLGVAIIALTLIIRFILFPLSHKSIVSQKALQELQPEMQKLKEKHKDDREKTAKATMELYKEKKISPLSSCLPMLVQLPILIALYRVFLDGLTNGSLELLYPFISRPEVLNASFFGIVDLSQRNLVLALLAGGLQFIQSKMLVKNRPPSAKTKKKGQMDIQSSLNTQMVYMMPILTIFFAFSFPAGLALYWVTTTIFAIGQQFYILRMSQDKKGNS